MPIEAVGLALAAAFYPTAIVALIAVVRGTDVRGRVITFFAGAALMTWLAGGVLLAIFVQGGTVPSHHPSVSEGVYIALGVVSVMLALVVWRRTPRAKGDTKTSERIERFTANRKLVFLLGFVMYAPSPLYAGAMKVVADQGDGTVAQATIVFVLGAIVLLMAEAAVAVAVLAPDRATAVLTGANLWLRRNARVLSTGVLAGGGVYLIVKGLVS